VGHHLGLIMFGTSPPNWTPTVHGSETLAPFFVYTPIILGRLNSVPMNAPFVTYTPIILGTFDGTPMNAPFTVRS